MSENVTKNELDEIQENDTIKEQTNEGSTTSADVSTSEDTLAAYEALFEKQKKQIEEQIETNKSLQNQINILMRNGASVSRETLETEETPQKETDSAEYVSLAELGTELGKRDYKTQNEVNDYGN